MAGAFGSRPATKRINEMNASSSSLQGWGSSYTDGGRRKEGFTQEKNDCTVRAVAIACEVSYADAHEELRQRGRKDGKGFAMTPSFKANPVVCGKRLVKAFDFIDNQGKCICLVTARRMFPRGRYIVRKSGHAFALIDGVDHDLSGNSKWIMVKAMWRVETVTPGTSETL
jgi:hypothetical protein